MIKINLGPEDKSIAIVKVRNVYGNELIYPINPTAKLLARLANTKTLTREAIRISQELGIRFRESTEGSIFT